MKLLNLIITYLTAFLMMSLMVITTLDVIGRYVFNQPLTGSTEITEFCLGLLIFIAIPLISHKNEHIAVDLLENRLGTKFKIIRDIVVQMILIVSFCILAYGVYLLGVRAERDLLVSEILKIPVAIFNYLMAFSLFLSIFFCLQYLINYLKKIKM